MSFGFVRTKVVAAHPKHFIKFALPILIGFLAILVGQSTVAPPANASVYGTIYNVAPKLSGGDKYVKVPVPQARLSLDWLWVGIQLATASHVRL